MTRNKRRTAASLLLLVLLLVLWVVFNPFGRFGWCSFGFTIYNAIPRPVTDIQVRADGKVRRVAKTHDLRYEDIVWLLDPKPDLLIIATGWDGVTVPRPEIGNLRDCEVRILKTEEARLLFNALKRSGKQVAIHFHSTC